MDEVETLRQLLAEAYQVVGILADEAGRFEDVAVTRALDNLAQQRMVHENVLPFPCAKLNLIEECAQIAASHYIPGHSVAGPGFALAGAAKIRMLRNRSIAQQSER